MKIWWLFFGQKNCIIKQDASLSAVLDSTQYCNGVKWVQTPPGRQRWAKTGSCSKVSDCIERVEMLEGLAVQYPCPCCKATSLIRASRRRFISQATLVGFGIFLPFGEIYKFKHRGDNGCGNEFYVVTCNDSYLRKPPVLIQLTRELWTQAQDTKPGLGAFTTTASEYTHLISKDPASVFQKLLQRGSKAVACAT